MFKRKTPTGEFIMDPKWAFDPHPPSEATIRKELESFYGLKGKEGSKEEKGEK